MNVIALGMLAFGVGIAVTHLALGAAIAKAARNAYRGDARRFWMVRRLVEAGCSVEFRHGGVTVDFAGVPRRYDGIDSAFAAESASNVVAPLPGGRKMKAAERRRCVGTVPVFDIIELEAALQSGGLLNADLEAKVPVDGEKEGKDGKAGKR